MAWQHFSLVHRGVAGCGSALALMSVGAGTSPTVADAARPGVTSVRGGARLAIGVALDVPKTLERVLDGSKAVGLPDQTFAALR